MKSVWVVEEGDYSDYRVVGVFSSKENAELVSAKVGGTVAEWDVNPGVSNLRKGYNHYLVQMSYDGAVSRIERWVVYDLAGSINLYRPRYEQPYLSAKVWAKDDKHAIKIVNEYRIRLIASGEWKTEGE